MFTCGSSAVRRPFIDVDEIEPNLYLGNLEAATNESTCKDLRITHILTAYHFPVNVPDHIKSLFVCVDDCEDANLLTFFNDSNEFIKEGQKEGACLVHCYAGISRSSAFVIAYLMNKYGISMQEATKKVKEKRYQVCPNSGFKDQLQLYEFMGYKLDESCSRYRIYLLQQLEEKICKDDDFSCIASYATDANSRVFGDKFKCKKCRQCLFSEQNIILHNRGISLTWKVDTPSSLELCGSKSYWFIEVLPWIDEALTSVQGKIYCPKCHFKIGAFSWKGEQCVCGADIWPCFRIISSKVDRDVVMLLSN